MSMSEERLGGIEARVDASSAFVMADLRPESWGLAEWALVDDCRQDLADLVAEVRRLRAENEAMRKVFADACQEPGAMGDALALARREGQGDGRLEALLWSLRHKEPGEGWRRLWGWGRTEGLDASAAGLPPAVFDLLEGGELHDGIRPSRHYATPAEAMDAKRQAVARLARNGFPTPPEAKP